MSAVNEVLAQLRGERESLVGRVAALDNLIPQLERYVHLFGPVSSSAVPSNGHAETARRTVVAAPPTAAPVINRDEKRTQVILAILKNGPKATREIAQELRQDRLVVKQALQRLKKAGVLVATGATTSQRWAVPSTVAPVPSLAAAVGKADGPLCVRCRHRFNAHDPATGACTPPCICREFYA